MSLFRSISGKSASKLASIILAVGFLSLTSGCISIPPLVNVTHEHQGEGKASEDKILSKLEALERRMEKMERKLDERPNN